MLQDDRLCPTSDTPIGRGGLVRGAGSVSRKPDSEEKHFILKMILYVVNRDR